MPNNRFKPIKLCHGKCRSLSLPCTFRANYALPVKRMLGGPSGRDKTSQNIAYTLVSKKSCWLQYHNIVLLTMNSKNQKTLESIFKRPTPSNIQWVDIESLLLSIGAIITEGSGSRIRVKLNDVRAVFHRPHPEKVTDKGAVNSVRRFLENAGVRYDGV